MKDESLYKIQILDAVSKIERFTAKMKWEDFESDQKTQSAVIMQLILIGELSKKFSAETKSKVPLPWKNITGFRDRAIHDYFDMDLKIVWDTLINDIPVLKSKLASF